jgi:hypothetical protein
MTEKLLRVEAPHFVAGAIWQRSAGPWVCTEAAPILKWMINKSAESVRSYLERKGWKHQWL